MQMTIADFAKSQNVSEHSANGVITFLAEKGLVTKTDETRAVLDDDGKPKRGRPSAVYEFPETITISLT